MEHHYPTPLLFLLPCMCAAQPVITTSSQPQPGDQCVYVRSQTIAPFASGPNVSWDFTVDAFEPYQVVQYVAPGGLWNASSFPMATVAELHSFGSGHTFMQMSPTAWTVLGAAGEAWPDPLVLTNTLVQYPFPWTYGTEWADTYSYIEDGETIEEVHTWEANTHGTLILPSGLQLSVVGMAREVVQIDPGPPQFMAFDNTLELWAPGFPCAVAEINYALFLLDGEYMGEFFHTALIDDTQSAIMERSVRPAAKLWPNPVAHTLQLRGGLPGAGTVQLQVLDATGRMVQHHQRAAIEVEQGTSLAVPGLPPGVYMLQVLQEGMQSFSLRFVVE